MPRFILNRVLLCRLASIYADGGALRAAVESRGGFLIFGLSIRHFKLDPVADSYSLIIFKMYERYIEI